MRKTTEKEKIKTAFGRAAKTYDSVAGVQTLSSSYLCEMIATIISSPPKEILDVGCGTGVTSVEIMKIYPQARCTLCDISDEMIREAEKKIKNVQVIVCDAEKYDFSENYDLGISNLAMQWFESQNDFFEKILKYCRYFAFSIPTNESFFNWKKKLKNCGIFSDFYSTPEEIICACRRYGLLKKYNIKKYELQFETSLALGEYFKKLGATANFSGKGNGNMLSILRDKHAIALNYDVFFGVLERK